MGTWFGQRFLKHSTQAKYEMVGIKPAVAAALAAAEAGNKKWKDASWGYGGDCKNAVNDSHFVTENATVFRLAEEANNFLK